jgi:hypothetical protein
VRQARRCSYFGSEIGLYFAFLGMYTQWLLPLSVASLACWLHRHLRPGTPSVFFVDTIRTHARTHAPVCAEERSARRSYQAGTADNAILPIYALVTAGTCTPLSARRCPIAPAGTGCGLPIV